MEKILNNIMDKMNEIEYGFNLDNKDIYPKNDDEWYNDFSKQYFLQSPSQIINSKLGVCWDQVELERYYFGLEKISCESYFIVEYDGLEYPTHTFIIVELNQKYYWFEHSWEPYRGIMEFNSLEEALIYVKDLFIKMLVKRNISTEEVVIYKYSKPEYEISSEEFFKHCENGEKIIL